MRCAGLTARGARFERSLSPAVRSLLAVCRSWILVGWLLSISALLVACQDGRAAREAEAESGPGGDVTVVEAVTIRPQPFQIEVALTGQLEAEYDVIVRSELEGVIKSIEFEEGQQIAKGDVLFTMRDEEQRARLSEAQAQASLARDVYERTQTLTSRDISSVARRAEAAAALDEARAKVELAQLNLDRTRLLAPFDGVTGNRLVGPGEWVEPQTGLVSVSAIDQLQLHYLLPEPSIALGRIGGPVHVRVVAYPNERFSGTTFFVSPTVDRATRRLLAKAWVPNADHRLKPGMFANVDVVVVEKEGVLLVPDSAMVYDRHGTYVWQIDEESRARKVPVQIGIRRHGRVEVLDGVADGDRVITAGINKVKAGRLIEVAPPPPPYPGGREAGAPIHAKGETRATAEAETGAEG